MYIFYVYRLRYLYITCMRKIVAGCVEHGGVPGLACLFGSGDTLPEHHSAPGGQKPKAARELRATAKKHTDLAGSIAREGDQH